jgi:hypothetical protein
MDVAELVLAMDHEGGDAADGEQRASSEDRRPSP